MLVLRRRVRETILIGSDIVVTILALEGGRVKLGIGAPPNTPIVRKELLMRDRVNRAVHEEGGNVSAR